MTSSNSAVSSPGNTGNMTKNICPEVFINRLVLEKIRHFVRIDPKECSGMGLVRLDGGNAYIEDVKMLKQKNGSAHTDIDGDAVSKLMFDWRDRQGEVVFWWHSHVDMSAFMSGQDMETIRQLAQHGMCIASVFNKRQEVKTVVACRVTTPFSNDPKILIFEDVTIKVVENVTDEMKAAWTAEHEESVVKNHVPVHTGVGSWRSATDENWYYDDWNVGFSRGRNVQTFMPCKTEHPDFWDSFEQGRDFDIDWIDGSFKEKGGERWRKSKKYSDAYAVWAANGNQVSPQAPKSQAISNQSDVEERRAFALKRDEIVNYNPFLDMFELHTGAQIDANWYMSEHAKQFRNACVDKYVSDARTGFSGKDRAEADLQEQVAEYEQDMLDSLKQGQTTKEMQ